MTIHHAERLDHAHPLLKRLFEAVSADPTCPDFVVLDAQRGRAAQEKAFNEGHSRAHFGQSAHNWTPALALDICPYPIDWNDFDRFKALAVVVKNHAAESGIPIGWGGDWIKLKDMPHYELTPWRDFAKKAEPFHG